MIDNDTANTSTEVWVKDESQKPTPYYYASSLELMSMDRDASFEPHEVDLPIQHSDNITYSHEHVVSVTLSARDFRMFEKHVLKPRPAKKLPDLLRNLKKRVP